MLSLTSRIFEAIISAQTYPSPDLFFTNELAPRNPFAEPGQPVPKVFEDIARVTELAKKSIDGFVTQDDLHALYEDAELWHCVLLQMHQHYLHNLAKARRSVRGDERYIVLEDLDAQRKLIAQKIEQLTGAPPITRIEDPRTKATIVQTDPGVPTIFKGPDAKLNAGTTRLQLSWTDSHIVAWATGFNAIADTVEELRERLQRVGAPVENFQPSDPIRLPNGQNVASLRAPVSATLGWLVTIPSLAEKKPLDLAPSTKWMGLVAILAARLVTQGRFVMQLEKARNANTEEPVAKKQSKQRQDNAMTMWQVRWVPSLINHDELIGLTNSLPGAAPVLDEQKDPRAFTQAVLADLLHAVCSQAASLIQGPASPPFPRSASESAEAVLAHLGGQPFGLANQRGYELSKNLQIWAKSVLGASHLSLALQLDPPDSGGAWYLQTLVISKEGAEPVDAAMGNASNTKREQIKKEMERLEGLYPVLLRGKAKRRGEVVLSQNEAWELMADRGPILEAAGFEVRVPPLSKKRVAPGLKLTSWVQDTSVTGARQLTRVAWTAVFGDVELTAEEIHELASQSRPLVQAHGRWVELSHADLEQAAQALAERAHQHEMSGADMLRHALGLEGAYLDGGVQLEGEGWAADLLSSAHSIPEQPPTRPDGFAGELRSYQADALAWLDFLDAASLGGCLALDMGLGKTPTLLAHLAKRLTGLDGGPARGTALIITPPAVVGNWANEAKKFVPGLSVMVHHGQNRLQDKDFAHAVRNYDVVITTYGTAVRDIGMLDKYDWGKVVLDEAQIIKNPASETAQQLRRLNAHNRIVLTGTPIENGLQDLWALLDFTNPGLLGSKNTFVAQLSAVTQGSAKADLNDSALRTLNGVLVYRRTKNEPAIAKELPDRIDRLEHCVMTPEQIGLYQAVLDNLMADPATVGTGQKKRGQVLAAITALKQICNHPAAYVSDDDQPLDGRSGKLARLESIMNNVWDSGEKMLVFTHFAQWGEQLAAWMSKKTGTAVKCYHGGLSRGARDEIVHDFQSLPEGTPAAMVLSLKAGGTGLNLTAASHVVLYDRWWNPAVEDQARDRVWRIGQTKTVMAHRLVCPGTVDERVEEVVAGKRKIADIALPKSSSVADLDANQLQSALGINPDELVIEDSQAMSIETHLDKQGKPIAAKKSAPQVLDGTGAALTFDNSDDNA